LTGAARHSVRRAGAAALRPRLWLPILAGLILLAGCQEDAPPALEPGALEPGLVDAQRAACEAEGARWVSSEATGRSVCLRTPADANDSCATSADCEGVCLARSRSCAPVVPLFGCHEVINARGARQTLCLE